MQEKLTCDVIHVEIASRHEFNVHDLPYTRGIGLPRNMTGSTLVEDVAGTGLGRVGISAYKGSASNKCTEEKSGEHDRV